MTQTLVLGVIGGLTIGLLAVGIVLVYKANRFINLGHAQLGALSAVLLAKWILDWGVSWWLAFPAAVALGVATGLVVERWVIRPLRRTSRSTETLMLVTIGVAQLLLGEDRVLVDMTAQVGCLCRADPVLGDPTAALRSPSPVVRDGVVDVSRSAPIAHEKVPESKRPLVDVAPAPAPDSVSFPASIPRRNSPARPSIRRQSAWRRQSPRPSVTVARASQVMIAVPATSAFLRRRDVRAAIATALAVASLMLGIWIGRRQAIPSAADTAVAHPPRGR